MSVDAGWQEKQAALNAALAEAQAEFKPVTRTKRVEVKTKAGDRYSYTYAPLEVILSTCRPTLAKHGLALVQILEDTGTGPALRTELRHKDGGMVGGSFALSRNPEDPQALGSLLTYLRRYAITAILGIATEDDDDGAAAKGQAPGKSKPAAQAKPKPERGGFDPPAPKDDPELGGLVAEVQHQLDTLRKLEAKLGGEARDWTAWVRFRVGLVGAEMGTAEHYRKAAKLLAAEETKLIRELEESSKEETAERA